MSSGTPFASPRLHRAYLVGLGAVLLWAAVATVLPRLQDWRAHRQQADTRHAEAVLRSFSDVPTGLGIDPSATACYGVGDVCVESDLAPRQALVTFMASLSTTGVRFTAIDCHSEVLRAFPGDGATCQATGSRGSARIWAVAGMHPNPYWRTRSWAAVVVQGPNYVPARPPAIPPARVQPRSVIPPGWTATKYRCLPTDVATCGGGFDVRVHGDVRAAIDTLARRLVSMGFGINDPSTTGGQGLCRTPISGGQLSCRIFAVRYLAPHGQVPANVGVFLSQDSPTTTTGRVLVTG